MKIPPAIYLFLVIGILAASQSGNIIRLGEAPAVAMAFWRLLLATAVLAPWSFGEVSRRKGLDRRDRWLTVIDRRDRWLTVLAGVALSVHLISWIAAVQLTTVANAAILFSINPVLTAAGAYLCFGERVGQRLVIAIGIGLVGIVVMSSADVSLSPRHLLGNGLALLCSVFFTIYLLAGKRVRQKVPTNLYVCTIYGIAAAVALAGVLVMGEPLVDYSGRTWLSFILLALVPTLIGHTSFNMAIRYIKAGWLSAATVSEPLFAGLVAFYAWDEPITGPMVVGYLLVATSVIILALERPAVVSGRPLERPI
ncbi:MAG: DMT family transporter [Bradymonadales bacterium]|nr:DMT family transporter [Bradymonadales bacterium]